MMHAFEISNGRIVNIKYYVNAVKTIDYNRIFDDYHNNHAVSKEIKQDIANVQINATVKIDKVIIVDSQPGNLTIINSSDYEKINSEINKLKENNKTIRFLDSLD